MYFRGCNARLTHTGSSRAKSPIKDTATAISSLLEGFAFDRKQTAVETIITPPVTIGYCTDAST